MFKAFFEPKIDAEKIRDALKTYELNLPEGLRDKDVANVVPIVLAKLREQGKEEEATKLKKFLVDAQDPDLQKPKWLQILSIVIPICVIIIGWSTTISLNAMDVPEIKQQQTKQESVVEQLTNNQQKLIEITKGDKEDIDRNREDMKDIKREQGEHNVRFYGYMSQVKDISNEVKSLNNEVVRLRLEVEALRQQLLRGDKK